MRDEVFNHGSFLQSRMHARGVTCSDCHDPHAGQLRAEGNAVCAQCHASTKYDLPAHHRHQQASAGARCVACHMPSTTYMVVDPRHDHSMRVPRPDLSARMGTPNACNACHQDRPAQWAAQAIRAWLGRAPEGFQSFAEGFDAWARYSPSAGGQLLGLVEDREQPAIVRASALARLARDPRPALVDVAARALNDADELVRRAAVDVLSAADALTRARYLPRMTRDPVRAVRIAAARALAAVPAQNMPADTRGAIAAALEEYVAAQMYNADRPEAHLNLGALYQELGQWDRAEAAYRTASDLHPAAVQAHIGLAELFRARGDETRVQEVLQQALRMHPQSAPVHHVLGLSHARLRQRRQALEHLAAAARLGAGEPRYAYVYGVALNSYGDAKRAVAVLDRAHARFPGEPAILQALVTMLRDGGDRVQARLYAARLVELAPEDVQAQQLLRGLQP